MTPALRAFAFVLVLVVLVAGVLYLDSIAPPSTCRDRYAVCPPPD